MSGSSRLLPVAILVLLFALVASDNLVSAQTNEDETELAQRIMDLHRQEGYLNRAFNAAVQNVPAEQKESMRAVISKLDEDTIYALWASKVEEIFTAEEMKTYLEYASTDNGRSIIRKTVDFSFAMQNVLVSEALAAMAEE